MSKTDAATPEVPMPDQPTYREILSLPQGKRRYLLEQDLVYHLALMRATKLGERDPTSGALLNVAQRASYAKARALGILDAGHE